MDKMTQNNSPSLIELERMAVLRSSPTTLKQSLKKWKNLVKISGDFLKYKAVKTVLDFKNRAPKILKYPNSKLDRVAKFVRPGDYTEEQLTKIFKKMYFALQNQKYGQKLGISAPQIGINLRMMIVNGTPMVNPSWSPANQKEQTVEGCYSHGMNDIYRVERDKYGWASWDTLRGEHVKYKIKGNYAIAFQHCLDHLNGRCSHITGRLMTKEEKGL
jgi:peptide deformylase